MVASVKVDSMAFSNDAVALRKQVAQTYQNKTVEWIREKKITSDIRIKSTITVFLQKAQQEYHRRLQEGFPDPSYEPLIDLAYIGSITFFDDLREKIKAAIDASKENMAV